MGWSEYRRMRQAEKQAVDIRKTLRENGRHTAEGAKNIVKHGRSEDDHGNMRKTYKSVKGKGTDPTPTKADDARRIKEAKKIEARIAKERKAAADQQKRIAAEAKRIADQAKKEAKARQKAEADAKARARAQQRARERDERDARRRR